MKRRNMIITAITTALLFSHTALGGEAFNAENGELNYILPADNGYYMLCSGYIYFWNGDIAKQAIPLCSRPNCSHMTEDCAAHITNAAKKMYEADDGLYLLSLWPREDSNTGEKQMPIWRVEKDGSGKSIVGEIPDASSQNYTIFQNMIYYTAEDVQTDRNYQFSVWQMSLDGKNKKQIWKSDLYSGYMTTLQGVGDWLYVGESGYESAVDWTDPELNIETLQPDKNLFLYQPQTEEWKKIPIAMKITKY